MAYGSNQIGNRSPALKNVFVMAKQNLPKTRYSDAELKEFKVLISDKKDKAQKELDFYLSQLSETSDTGDGKNKGFEDGTSTAESERLSTMANRQRKYIQHLQHALACFSTYR